MENQFVYKEKSFPYLTVALTLFVIGLAMIGGIWIAAMSIKKTSSPQTTYKTTNKEIPTPLPLLTTKNATSSSQTTTFTFPTKQLTATISANWITRNGENDTHQIVNWWLPDNTVTIASPDIQPVDQTGCPEGGCPDMHGASVTITDYGANAFTTAQAWYEGKSTKDVQKTVSSPGAAQSITTGTFLTLPVYCVSTSAVNPVPTPPIGIPVGIFNGTCYFIWKAHIYAVNATLDTTSPKYQSNLINTTTLLKSIKLL